MNRASILTFVLAGILFLPAMVVSMLEADQRRTGLSIASVLWMLSGACGVIALGFFLMRILLAQRYDPNAEPVELRKETGQRVAVSKEQFLKSVQDDSRTGS
jgi:hypothetical protein